MIERLLRPDSQPLPIYDEASVSSARQRVRETGHRLSLSKEVVEKAALIASELTHNQLSHSRQGYFAVNAVERPGRRGLEIIAADIGPGIPKPAQAMREEVSTSGGLGAGLAAVSRLADEIEFDNRISEGACVIARNFEPEAVSLCCEAAIMGRPFPGEPISGDDGVFIQSESGFIAAVCDGLGHGPEARDASNCAVAAIAQRRDMELDRLLRELNEELADTRGCAASITRFIKKDRALECASVGDVHSHVYDLRNAHFFAATPLVLGAGPYPKQRIRIETATAEPGAVLVTFTDGLKSRTSLKGDLDILRQPAIAIAQHLLENYSRPNDDALVLVARFLS